MATYCAKSARDLEIKGATSYVCEEIKVPHSVLLRSKIMWLLIWTKTVERANDNAGPRDKITNILRKLIVRN